VNTRNSPGEKSVFPALVVVEGQIMEHLGTMSGSGMVNTGGCGDVSRKVGTTV
jgi:hypothetical protein